MKGDFIAQLLAHAGQNPEHPALIDGETFFSYRELVFAMQAWTARLAQHDLHKGDRVGICLKDNWLNVLAMLSAAYAGVVFVPLDWQSPASSRLELASLMSLDAVLLEPEMSDPGFKRSITVDDHWSDGCDPMPAPDYVPDDDMFIMLSSGTTGLPKGALISRSNFTARVEADRLLPGKERYFSAIRLCFGAGAQICLKQFAYGQTVILAPHLFSPVEFAELINDIKPSYLFLVPSMVNALLQLPRQNGLLLPSLELLGISGAALSPEVKEQIPGRICKRFYEVYATTAAGMISRLFSDELDLHAKSSGKLNKTVTAEILDDSGNLLATGVPGLLRCKGPGVARNFIQFSDEDGGSEYIADSWCYTGDIAVIDRSAYITVLDRSDDVIIINGINVYPQLIEKVLESHPKIQVAAVLPAAAALHKTQTEPEIEAFVETNEQLNMTQLLHFCRTQLAAYSIPARFYRLQNMPLNSSGKVDKLRLFYDAENQTRVQPIT